MTVVVVVLVAVAIALPRLQRTFSTDSSVSAAKLVTAVVERGPFVRDIAGEGRVVAAFAPTVYAPHAGAVELRVHAGDTVRKDETLVELETDKVSVEVSAPEAGVLSEIVASEGATVGIGAILARMGGTGA